MKAFKFIEGEGKQISFRGTKMTLKVTAEQSENAYSLIEIMHPPNIGPALHIHPNASEAYYVLEGDYYIKTENETHHVKTGDFVFIPKGIPHNYKSGENGGKVLVIAPPGLEKYFTEVANTLSLGPISWDLEQKIARAYGQEFLDNLSHWGQ